MKHDNIMPLSDRLSDEEAAKRKVPLIEGNKPAMAKTLGSLTNEEMEKHAAINCTVIKAEVDLPDQPRDKNDDIPFGNRFPATAIREYNQIKAIMDDYDANEDDDTLPMRVSDLIVSKKSSERRNKKLVEENKRLSQIESNIEGYITKRIRQSLDEGLVSTKTIKCGDYFLPAGTIIKTVPNEIDQSKTLNITWPENNDTAKFIAKPVSAYTYEGKNPPTRYYLIEHDDVPETSEMRVTHTTDNDWKTLYPDAKLVGEYVLKDGAAFMDFDCTTITPLQVFDSLFPSQYDTGTQWYQKLRTALVDYDQIELSLMPIESGASSLAEKVEWLSNDHATLLLERNEMQDIIDNDLKQPVDELFDEIAKDLHKLYSWFNKEVVIKMVCLTPLIAACLYEGSFIWAALIFAFTIWFITADE